MFGFLLGLINPLGRITDKLVSAYAEKQNAATDQQRIAADERISILEARKDIILAASQYDKWWSTRELIGKCALIYVFKIVVWDTVLGLGVTQDPGSQVTGIVMLVLAFYFGSRALTETAERLLSAIGRRK